MDLINIVGVVVFLFALIFTAVTRVYVHCKKKRIDGFREIIETGNSENITFL